MSNPPKKSAYFDIDSKKSDQESQTPHQTNANTNFRKKSLAKILIGMTALFAVALASFQAYSYVSAIQTTIGIVSDGGGTAADLQDDLNQILLQKLSGWNVDVVAWNGDIGYDVTTGATSSVGFAVNAYDASTAGLAGLPLFLAEGNHEAESAADVLRLRQMYARYQTYATTSVHGPLGWNFSQMPNVYSSTTNYAYDIGDIRVIVVNQYAATSSDAISTTGKVHDLVFDWVKKEIKTTTKQHIAVMAHEPSHPVPSQPSGNHIGDSLDADPANRDKFVNLLASFGQVNHFVGHTHIADLYELRDFTIAESDARNATISIDGGIWELDTGGFGDKATGTGSNIHTCAGVGYLHTNSANWGDYNIRLVYGCGSPQWTAPVVESVTASDLTRQILVNTWQGAGTGTSSNGLFDMKYYVDYTPAVAANPDWSANNSGKWWEPAFNATTASWTAGELGVGYKTVTAAPAWINTPIDPFGGLGTTTAQVHSIMQRVTFPATTTAAYSNMTLHLDDDDGVMVWLNGTLIFNGTNATVTAPTTGSGAEYFDKTQTTTTNAWAGAVTSPTFTEYNVTAFKGALIDGQNTLAIWNINAGTNSDDLGAAVRLSISGQADIAAPTLTTSVSSTTPTVSTANVTWGTNEVSDSQVEYGLTTSYGQSTTLDTNMVTSHSVNISGLATSTLYHFRVKSRDASSNLYTSGDYTFMTPASTPSTTTVMFREGQNGYTGMVDTHLSDAATTTNFGTNGVVIVDGETPYANGLMKWDLSSIPSNAVIQDVKFAYNITDNSGTSTYTFYRSIKPWTEAGATWNTYDGSTAWGDVGSLDSSDDYTGNALGSIGSASTGLATSTLNSSGIALVQGWVNGSIANNGFFVTRTVASATNGLQFTSSEGATVGQRPALVILYNLPSGPDVTPPVITASSTSPLATSATLTFDMNELATSTLDYGTTASYGTASSSAAASTTQRYVITGLTANTTYHYRLTYWDASGNMATTTDLTFTTPAPDVTAPTIVGTVASSTTGSTATITATTTEAASMTIVYGTSTGVYTGSVASSSLSVTKALSLTGLTASTAYYFRIVSTDASSNVGTSSEMIFTTTAAATTVVLREGVNGYSGMIDTYLDSAATTTNQANNAVVAIDGSPALTGLMKWDLSSIPSNATVSNVSFVYNVTNITANTYDMYRSLRAWTEAGATWNTYDGTNSWGTVGGLNATTDYNSTVLATSGVNALGLATSTFNASGIAVVQGWIDGTIANNGLTLHRAASTDSLQFDSSEGSTATLRPALVITYTVSGPDVTAPNITSVASSTTDTTATIGWTSTESATSTVEYGLTTSYGSASSSAVAATTHSTVLTGLTQNTLYHYRIKVWDAAGNASTSPDYTFTTAVGDVVTDAWWDESWGKRIKVTFNNSAQNENLNDFPVRVSLNSSRIAYGDFKAGGDDIRFVDTNGSTVLPYEIDTWNTSGTSDLWVKVPRVNSGSATDHIYMYYNNPAASAGEAATSVWDSSYKAVWHMTENPAASAPQMLDSTSNGKNGTTAGSMASNQSVTGTIGNALNLTGDDYVAFGAPGAMASGRTTSMWVNGNSWVFTGSNANSLFAYNTAAGGNTDILRVDTSGRVGHYDGATLKTAAMTAGLSTGTWYHLVFVASSTSNASYIYQNGVLVATATAWAPAVGGTDVFFAGQEIDVAVPSDFFNGKQDEIRIESTARTPNWIAAQYMTQADTFQSYAAPEEADVDDTTEPTVTGIASSTSDVTATINWTTSEAATSTVQYGLTASYGTASTSAGTTTHSVVLSGLDPSTAYHFRITAVDASSNSTTTTDMTFMTTAVPDTTAPSVAITAPANASTVSGTSVALTATAADTGGVVGVKFYVGTTLIQSEDTSEPYGLTWDSTSVADGSRVLLAVARDSSGNIATSSPITVTVDNTAPSITSIASSTTETTANVDFNTGESAFVRVHYGTTVSYGQSTTLTSSGASTHTVSIAGLTASTLYHFQVEARDASGNLSTSTDRTFTTAPDTGAPGFISISATPSASGATINWTTDENSSSQVQYGPSSGYGFITAMTDTSPRVASHAVSLSGLNACTVYHYRVISRDAANNSATSSDQEFATTGCTGNSSVGANEEEQVASSTGGTVELIQGGEGITLGVPAGYSSTTSAYFQIIQLDANSVQTGAGAPSGLTPVNTYTFHLNAVASSGAAITAFDNPITITMSYSDADLAGFDESTLVIYRFDGSAWHELTGCIVDTVANTVTCTTTSFSDFALFGEYTAPASGGGSSGGVAPGAQSYSSGGYNVSAATSTVPNNANVLGCLPGARFNILTGKPCLANNASAVLAGGGLAEDPEPGAMPPNIGALIFTKQLRFGMDDKEVKSLQLILNSDKATRVAESGVGSMGKETTYFGALTKQAVTKFQIKYKVIKNAKDPFAGTVGPGTRAVLNKR